jgi:response regulator RpfG family c-di-GMP phosphodiesterase
MARYSRAIAAPLGWTTPQCRLMRDAASLHDLGKIGYRGTVVLAGYGEPLLSPYILDMVRTVALVARPVPESVQQRIQAVLVGRGQVVNEQAAVVVAARARKAMVG